MEGETAEFSLQGPLAKSPLPPMPTKHLPLNRNPKRGWLGLLAPLPFFSSFPSSSSPLTFPGPFFSRLCSCRPLQSGRQDAEVEGWVWVVFGWAPLLRGPFRGSERGVSVRKTLQSAHPAASGPPPHWWRHPPATNGRLAEVMSYTCPWLRRDSCLQSSGPKLSVPAFLPYKIKFSPRGTPTSTFSSIKSSQFIWRR